MRTNWPRAQPIQQVKTQPPRADRVQMESSERVKMLEKQSSRAGCVNPCERNHLVVRSPLSVPDSGVNRPTKHTASGARGLSGQGIGQHESHH
jgi:hypothetical protein